jgi:membrane associated rhomboid family serine protease
LIPLRDTVPTRHRPVVTLALIAINVAVFLVELAAPQQHLPTARGQVFAVDGQSAITAEYGFVPCELRGSCPLGEDTVDFGANAPFRVHHVPVLATALTSMFVHAGWAHLGFNMLFLWVFGSKVEDRLGRARFLAFYLLGGVAALGLQFLSDPGSAVATIGASGAIAAVLASWGGSRSGCWRSGGSIPGRARRPTPSLWPLPGGADAERLHRQHHAV